MNRKVILFSVMAVASVLVVIAASAAAVFAFTVDSVEPAQVETVIIEEAPEVEVAPVQAELSPDKPVLDYDRASYKSGCSYNKSTTQLTQAPAEALDKDAPIAQLSLE